MSTKSIIINITNYITKQLFSFFDSHLLEIASLLLLKTNLLPNKFYFFLLYNFFLQNFYSHYHTLNNCLLNYIQIL